MFHFRQLPARLPAHIEVLQHVAELPRRADVVGGAGRHRAALPARLPGHGAASRPGPLERPRYGAWGMGTWGFRYREIDRWNPVMDSAVCDLFDVLNRLVS